VSQLLYNLRLVGKSLRRDRWFTIVMVFSQALGVSLFVTALTTVRRYSNMAGQVRPGAYRVEGDPDTLLRTLYRQTQFAGFGSFSAAFLDLPAARALTATGIATESSTTFVAVMAGGPVEQPPRRLPVRFCDADLFGLFNVEFLYGGPWRREDERGPSTARVTVLADIANQQLFGGANSVGRMVRVGGEDFRVVGVTRQPSGKLNMWDFGVAPENVGHAIVPMALADTLRPVPELSWPPLVGSSTWATTAASRVAFVEYWVRLTAPAARARFEAAMSTSAPRARLVSGDDVVTRHQHAPPPYRIFLIFTLVLLEASVINVMRMLLAKASSRSAEIGIHRALGAGRGTIFARQLCEGVLVSLAGSLVGLALALPTVAAFDRLVPDSPVKLALTPYVVATTLLVCLLASLVSGIYPAWRVASEPPTRYLGKI
jgi:putative ABC transport system permease protein